MRYLVDGYNLAHALGLIRGKVSPSGLAIIRKTLLQKLSELPGADPSRITIVFDAQNLRNKIPEMEITQGFRLVFSMEREADDVIEEMIEKEKTPSGLTVVSNDNRLRLAARKGKCIPVSCLDFIEILMKKPASGKSSQLEGPEKPDGISPDEMKKWLDHFGVDDRGF